MQNHEIDKLLERTFAGDPSASGFHADVLRDSTVALVRARRMRRCRCGAGVAMAATLIACGAFLLGRSSMSADVAGHATEPVVAAAPETVAVSNELIAWLEAANLFRQLGMDERMERALERANNLRAYDQRSAEHLVEGRAVAGDGGADEAIIKPVDLAVLPRLYEPIRSTDGIMASSLGGYGYANESD